jgi:hypothetical protein
VSNFVVSGVLYPAPWTIGELGDERDSLDYTSAMQAANMVDFIETLTSDYQSISDDLISLLRRMTTVTEGAVAFLLALYVIYWAYIETFWHNTILDVEVTAAMVFLLAVFINTYLRIRRSKEDVWHLDFHMEELIESHMETVINTERTETSMSEDERIVSILRKADPNLDGILEESPNLLQLGTEVKGKKLALNASVFVAVPWKSTLDKIREGAGTSKFELVWIAIRYDGDSPASLDYIKPIHEKLTDILQFYEPADAKVILFSEKGFSPEAIAFAENEDNWIPHWKEGTDEEVVATLDLVKIEVGSYSVVTMPYLKMLRQERLEIVSAD